MSPKKNGELTVIEMTRWLKEHGVQWAKCTQKCPRPWIAADVRDLENVRLLGKFRTFNEMIRELYKVHY